MFINPDLSFEFIRLAIIGYETLDIATVIVLFINTISFWAKLSADIDPSFKEAPTFISTIIFNEFAPAPTITGSIIKSIVFNLLSLKSIMNLYL